MIVLSPEVPAAQPRNLASTNQSTLDIPDPSPQLLRLRWAIIGQESNAKFRAVNPHSGALGYAQIMPKNLTQWSKEALDRVVTPREFLTRPDIQLAVIDFKLNQYWQASLVASDGNEEIAIMRVAAWWYSGKPNLYRSTRPQFYNGYPYPSIAAYSRKVLQRYRSLLGDTENAVVPNNRTAPASKG